MSVIPSVQPDFAKLGLNSTMRLAYDYLLQTKQNLVVFRANSGSTLTFTRSCNVYVVRAHKGAHVLIDSTDTVWLKPNSITLSSGRPAREPTRTELVGIARTCLRAAFDPKKSQAGRRLARTCRKPGRKPGLRPG